MTVRVANEQDGAPFPNKSNDRAISKANSVYVHVSVKQLLHVYLGTDDWFEFPLNRSATFFI